MPVITRSGPTRKMAGVKRKFVEIDSDDETETVCSECDSEFHPDELDELKDTVDDLMDQMKMVNQQNNTLVDMFIKERETSYMLREEIENLKNELEDVTKQRDALLSEIKDYRKSSLIELIVLSTILGFSVCSLFAYRYSIIKF